MLGVIQSLAVETLVNGNFSAGLTGWRLHPDLGIWNPVSDGAVHLNPISWNYSGPIVYQNLNVAVSGGTPVTLKVRLKNANVSTTRTIAMDLDYVSTGGVVQRLRLLQSDDATIADWTNCTATVTLPGDATNLVRLVVTKAGWGDFWMDDVSLTAAGTVGAVPQITGVDPLSGPLGTSTLLTLRGTNFGTATGQVIIGTWPAGMIGYLFGPPLAQIASWNNTQIVARVVEPLRSGGIYVMAGGVEANGAAAFTVTSPNFIVNPVQTEMTAVKGTTAQLLLRVNFLNGFTSTNGVSFMVVDPPGIASSTDLPVKQDGGFGFALDTSTLAAGTYRGLAQSLEDHSFARFIPFKLKVINVTNINIFEYDDTYQKISVASKTITNQGESPISFEAIDNEGNIITTGGFGPPGALPINVTSSDPERLLVFDTAFGPRFLAQQSGTVTLTFTAADGFVRTLPVTINLPAAPYVDTASLSAIADNSGLFTNTFYLHATEPLGWIGYEGFLNISFDTLESDPANHAASWTFPIPAGTPPGNYLFHGEASGAKRFAVLTIVNTATRGQITGTMKVADNGGLGGPQDLMGALECYNATQTLVSSNWVESYNSDTYLAAYIPPGTHRVRFVPASMGYPALWYPNAADFAAAQPVTVAAGTTVSNINFYFVRTNEPPTGLTMTMPHCQPGHVALQCDTLRGLTYHLEATASLTPPNWVTIQSLTGDGGACILSDPAAPADGRFYRVRITSP